MRKRGEKKNF